MDAFDRYGQSLVDAGRRRRVERQGARRRAGARVALVAAAAVVIAIAAASTTSLDGVRPINAQAVGLVARVSRMVAESPVCRVIRPNEPGFLLRGVAPQASTLDAIAALGRPQSALERHALTAIAAGSAPALSGSAILGDSLRVLHAPNGVSVTIVVARRPEGASSARADSVGCVERQQLALERVVGELAARRRAIESIDPRRTPPSPAVVASAKRLLATELGQASERPPAGDVLWATIRDHGRLLADVTSRASSFLQNGMTHTQPVIVDGRTWRTVFGLVPDGVSSVELESASGDRQVVTVRNNLFVARLPLSFGTRLLATWNARHENALRRVRLEAGVAQRFA